ncbi:MAG: polymerase [Solirubrobacteraceae bacterium]|nr:polymerase [Solirubrobacteraceae bacterium]
MMARTRCQRASGVALRKPAVATAGSDCEHTFVFCEPGILHADADAFYASVAQRDDPALRGRPVLVGGGIVIAASYEARRYGVRSGMGGSLARRLCPQAIVAEPSWSAYRDASEELFAVLRRTALVVEALSIEEAFLDVSGLDGSARDIAVRLRREVREQVGLPITVGVARTKIVAKMASRAAKPDGLLVVPAHAERAFLDRLKVEQLWGIGPATASKLHDRGLRTVGDLAVLSEAALIAILGKGSGRHVHALAQNRDRRPVQAGRRRRSFGSQRAFGRSSGPPADLDAVLAGLVERVTRRLLAAGEAGRTVVLRLRFGDYSRATRSHTLPEATAAPEPILAATRMLLAAAMPAIERRGLTCIGVTVANLAGAGSGTQLELLDGARPET